MENNEYIVQMEKITKIFSENIIANKAVSLKIKKGEIYALVGENGAGKSTLMSILFGLYQPTSGTIKINNQEVVINNTVKATTLGIGMVHQHFRLIENFTVLQNIILGTEPVYKWQLLHYKKAREQIAKIIKKYNLDVDLDLKIEHASVGVQQRVEILKVLYRNAEIIVFDEPTAVLTPQEIEGLLTIIKNLRSMGKTIIFISHKLEEVKKIADTITVIRKGKIITSFPGQEKSISEIADLMVGREIVTVKNNIDNVIGKVILRLQDVNITKTNQHRALHNINLEVKAGEIVAIAGVEGNGQTELIYGLGGILKIDSGKVFFSGEDVTNKSARFLYRKGLSHIPEDRHKFGVILDYSVMNNMVLQNVDSYPYSTKWGLLSQKAIQNNARWLIKKYDIRGSDNGFALMNALSGGNQQKAVVARELERKHRLLLVSQPTRGLDVGAIEYIHSCILNEKRKNNAVLLVSYELSEVMSLADRIIVMFNGSIIGDVDAKTISREELGLMMTGKVGNEDIRKESKNE